jgi:peptide chain release factor subunit 1
MSNAETVRRIAAFRADGYPVLSVYLGTQPDLPDLATRAGNLLHQIRPLTVDGSVGRAARTSIGTDLRRIESVLSPDRWRGGGVAIFACAGRNLFEEVTLPRRVRDRIVVDAAPWIRPMAAVLEEYPQYGVLLVSRSAIRIWELVGRDLREARGLAARPDSFDVLIVGGQQEEVAGYVSALPRPVRTRVAASFPVDPATATVDSLRHDVLPLADGYEREKQQRWVAEIFDVYDRGGLAVLGLQQCLQAGSVGAVTGLVVESDVTAAGVVCEACGWLGLWGPACAACECPVRGSDDVIDELVESVIEQGGAVHRIRVDTPLRGWSVAATLRFSLEAVPAEAAELVTTGQIG